MLKFFSVALLNSVVLIEYTYSANAIAAPVLTSQLSDSTPSGTSSQQTPKVGVNPQKDNASQEAIRLSDRPVAFDSIKASDLRIEHPLKPLLYSQVSPEPTQPATPPPDKSRYTLFNPTPRELRRDFNTDRPNQATSPLTVDAGVFQIETDLVNYSRQNSDEDGNTNEKYLFVSNTLRVGLTNSTELRLLLQPYNLARTRFRDTGRVEESSGIDTLQAGLKINISGNDTYKKPGDTAFGLLPFINLPTSQNNLGSNSIEGGLAFLSAFKLSDTLDIEAQLELDVLKNASGEGYHAESLTVISLDYQINDKLGTYFEVAGRFGNESRFGGVVTFDTGLLVSVGKDLQLDAGINVGLTRAADNLNPFIGISKRF